MRNLNYYKSFGLFINLLMMWSVQIEGAKRTLTSQLNPDCPTTICTDETADTKITLIHVQADGDNDTLHYIWDLSRQPSVLVALSERNTSVTIDWNTFFKDANTSANSVKFSNKPKYTMSFVLTKVFIFDDDKDHASIIGVNATKIEAINTAHLTWSRENFTVESGLVEVLVSGVNESLIGHQGTINLKLKCYEEEDHDSDIPHLLHSINVTQIDMEFIDLASNASFGSPRIAAEFVLLASESPSSPFKISKRKTIDDEHTPGVFTLMDVISPDGVNGTQGSYLQFRPISYTDESRDITTTTEVHLSEPSFLVNSKSYLNSSLVWSFYGDAMDTNLIQAFNISFGETNDEFYSHTNYTTWTCVLGYGSAPPERVSMLIAVLACIGLGIPLLVLIAGGIYLAVKRMRNC